MHVHMATGRLLDAVARAADDLGPFDTAVEEADAQRHLLRLLSAATDLFIERADPARPLPTVWMSPTRKFLGDSPDTIYTTVPVDAAHGYRLTIDPGEALYTGVVVYGRTEPSGAVHTVATTNDQQIQRVDGRYLLTVGGPGATAPDLALDDTAFWVMVRQYFADPYPTDRGPIGIERTDGVTPDGPPDPDALATGIARAAAWIEAQARADAVLDGLMRYPEGSSLTATAPPEVPDDLVSLFFPTPDISYQGCRIALADGERLEATFTPPPCRYWSLVLTTPWLESVEQRRIPASVNSERYVASDDGSVTVVVSEHEPGMPNWIPLRGYRRAQVAYRVLLAAEPPDDVSFAVRAD